jgi:hypothetical protein
MDDEIVVKTAPLYFTEPKLGDTLYAWGKVSTYVMTKEEYMELFGDVTPTDQKDETP